MPSPSSLREVRVQVGSTFRTAQLNAGADGDWNISNDAVHKLRVTAVDTSGLTQPGIDDETIQTRMHSKPPVIDGMAKGSAKVTCYAGGAFSNVETPPEWNVASAMAGGLQEPTNRSGLATSAISTVSIGYTSAAGTGAVRGMAVLCGERGDGRGNGEVKPINAVDTNDIDLSVATAAAVTTGDTLVFSTTIFPDEDATQQYADLLMIGHASADQIQAIGAAGPFTLTSVGAGELPKIEFDLMVADWQYQPAGSRASLQHGSSPHGGKPPFDRSAGYVHVGDYGSDTRNTYRVSDFTFNPGLAYQEIADVNGINGVGGHQHMPGVPTMEFTILTGDEDGILDDFPDTEKTIIAQFGRAATKCIAFELPRCYVDEKPQRVEVNGLTGWRVMVHGTEEYTATSDLESAAWRIHIF